MLNEHDHPADADRSPKTDEPAGAAAEARVPESADEAPAPHTGATAGATSNDGDDRTASSAPQPVGSGRLQITAIEIENFKGIGRPMRIDLRPITLLFGNNSAGKSTVLHALCYAHEILSHRNVDVHKTDLGGDRIDLGGFRNLVHAHGKTRTVRLRFELNLEGWSVPQELADKIHASVGDSPGWADGFSSKFDESERPRSGWMELQAKLRGERPELVSYEIGVNGTRVGRLHAPQPFRVLLEINSAHPLLERCQWHPSVRVSEEAFQPTQMNTRAKRVRESSPEYGDGSQLSSTDVGLPSPLPLWGEVLSLGDPWDSRDHQYDITYLTATVSILVVGIGQTLRDELGIVRYIGPTRDIHPQTRIGSAAPDPRLEAKAYADFVTGRAKTPVPQASRHLPWADGNAAWVRLRDPYNGNLIREVSAWLAREDRLDTGYALHEQSLVTIQTNAELVPMLREYHRLRVRFRDADESVDLGEWAREEAENIVAGISIEMDGVNRTFGEIRNRLTEIEDSDYSDENVDHAWRCLRERTSVTGIAAWIAGIYTDARHGSPDDANDTAGFLVQEDVLDMFKHADVFKAEQRTRARLGGGRFEMQKYAVAFKQLLTLVERAQKDYRRLTELVTKVESRDFTSAEVQDLAAAMAVRPPQREIQLVTAKTDLPLRPSDIGVGISQVLPVVVAALDPDRPGITAIEQPELHLHPRVQVQLGDLFAQQATADGIFLLETHSEHLMLRLLRRIEETHSGELPAGKPALRPEQVSVVFIEQIDGEVRATPLRIDKTGEFIDRWPQGFFDERDEELF